MPPTDRPSPNNPVTASMSSDDEAGLFWQVYLDQAAKLAGLRPRSDEPPPLTRASERLKRVRRQQG